MLDSTVKPSNSSNNIVTLDTVAQPPEATSIEKADKVDRGREAS